MCRSKMATDVVESRGKQRTSTTKSRPSTATSSTSEISTKQGTTRNPQIPRPRPSTATASTSEASTSNVSSVQYATGSSYIGSSGTSISSRTSLSSLRESLPENPHIYDFSEISSATNIGILRFPSDTLFLCQNMRYGLLRLVLALGICK